MCEGFGVIVTKDGRYLFCEPTEGMNCKHGDILHRAGIEENTDAYNRAFVRVQFSNWTKETFEFDEIGTLPAWVNEEEVKERCCKLLDRVYPALAEYEKVRDAAWAEYEKVRDAAYAEYEKVRDAAWAEYEKVRAAALAEFVSKISSIDGYVGK